MERALVLVAHEGHSSHAPAVKWEAGEARVVAGCNLPSQSPSSHPILVFSFLMLCVLSWLHSWGACGGADSDSGSGGVLALRLPLLLHSIALLSLLSFSYWVSKLVAGPLLDPSVHLMPRPSSCACNSAYLINPQIMTFQLYCPEFALDDSCLAAKRNTG